MSLDGQQEDIQPVGSLVVAGNPAAVDSPVEGIPAAAGSPAAVGNPAAAGSPAEVGSRVDPHVQVQGD